MKTEVYKVKAKVWLWKGNVGWHFVTIEKCDAEKIKDDYIWPRRGFGSIPVLVTIGKTSWKTSVFPEKKGSFVLPLKKQVRDKEEIEVGDEVVVWVQMVS